MATSATSSSPSTAGTYFTGSSTFSADLNNQISHAVAEATLPITQLQNEQSTLTGQQTELQTLGSDFSTLQTAIGAIDSAVSSGSLSASVSNNSVASVSLGTGALAGSYSINITSLGAHTNTISSSSNSTTKSTAEVTDPTAASLSTSTNFTLTVGTTTYSLTPSGNTLDALVSAINSSGAQVQASAVNVGTSAAPSYQLSIQGTASAVQLNDGTNNLLGTTTTASTGVLAVADPTATNISTSSTFTLTVGTTPYSLTPASNNLDSLVAAINASGASVQATVVNVGGSANPNYELSIQGTQNAASTIQLSDGTHSLLTTMNAGSPVTYSVNGQASVTSSTTTISLSTGLTVTARATGSASVTVAQSASGVENALSSLATSYNAAVDEITGNRGQNGGALAGQAILGQLSSALQTLPNYTSPSSSGVQTMTDLGLTFDTNGHLQFDSSVFESTASSSLGSVMSFLGSESANTGFLGAVGTALTGITDTTTGVIVSQMSSLASTVSSLGTKIASDQTALTLMQTNLTAQMEAADSAVATMQSQVTELTDMFSAQQAEQQAISLG